MDKARRGLTALTLRAISASLCSPGGRGSLRDEVAGDVFADIMPLAKAHFWILGSSKLFDLA